MIKAILAHGLNGEIGKDNKLLWHLPKDLEYFKEQTFGQVVVMGRNTFLGLPFVNGLPYRDNWVITSKSESLFDIDDCNGKGFYTFFVDCNYVKDSLKDGWVIGGKSIYEQLEYMIDEYHITKVQSKYPEADTFFKPDLTDFEEVGEEIDVSSDKLEAFVQIWRRRL